jgi:hypothetical protein
MTADEDVLAHALHVLAIMRGTGQVCPQGDDAVPVSRMMREVSSPRDPDARQARREAGRPSLDELLVHAAGPERAFEGRQPEVMRPAVRPGRVRAAALSSPAGVVSSSCGPESCEDPREKVRQAD